MNEDITHVEVYRDEQWRVVPFFILSKGDRYRALPPDPDAGRVFVCDSDVIEEGWEEYVVAVHQEHN